MKKSVKLLTVLLALIMVLSIFASCTTDEPSENTPESTTPSQSTPEASTPNATPSDVSTPEGTPPNQSSSASLENFLPPELNLDREIKIFVGTLYDDEWLDKDDGDIVGTEIYNRVSRVEKALGIELTVDTQFGDNAEREKIINEIKKRQQSTDPNIITDLASTFCNFAGTLTLDGVYQTINNSDCINFDSPWWPDDLLENSTIDDKIYFVSGDISPTLLYETYAIYYNTKLLEKYNVENPIDLVLDYKWTLDKLIEITSGIYEDVDTTVIGPSMGDFFSFEIYDGVHARAFPFAMGIRVIEPDEDEGYVWSDLYIGLKMETILEKVVNWTQNNNGVIAPYKTNYPNFCPSFQAESAMFALAHFAYSKNILSGTTVEYGVVPCPMYDEEQREYITYYGNPTSFWGIPSNVSDVDMCCTLLEYLAADAYVYISPAIFEKALKYKYVNGEGANGLSKMFDIIRDGLVFDACMFYYTHIGGTNYRQFTELTGTGTSWVKNFQGFKLTSMKSSMKGLVTKLRELPY